MVQNLLSVTVHLPALQNMVITKHNSSQYIALPCLGRGYNFHIATPPPPPYYTWPLHRLCLAQFLFKSLQITNLVLLTWSAPQF
jgi:hypothetical protein